MNKITNITIGVIAVVGLVLGGIAVSRAGHVTSTTIAGGQGPVGPQGPRGPQGPQGPAGRDGSNGSSVRLGAVASPDIPSPYLRWGDVSRFQAGTGLTISTSTVCAIQSPTATSTLVGGGANFLVGSSTALLVTISRSTTAFGTTTGILATSTIAANAQGFVNALATSTAFGLEQDIIQNSLVFSPNQWLVVGVSGGALGTGGNNAPNNTNPNFGFQPVGRCTASWMQVGQ